MPRTLSTQIERDIEAQAEAIREWANDVIDDLYSDDYSYKKGHSLFVWYRKLLPLTEQFALAMDGGKDLLRFVGQTPYFALLRSLLDQMAADLPLLNASREYGAAYLDWVHWQREYNRLSEDGHGGPPTAESYAEAEEAWFYQEAAFRRVGNAWGALMALWEEEQGKPK